MGECVVNRLLLVFLLLLAGCVTKTTLIADDGKRYEMQVDPVSQGLSTEIETIQYKGSYVTNDGFGVGFGQSLGANPAFGTTTMIMSGNSGQALLTAANGDFLECGFNYSGLTVLGRCQSKMGKSYTLTTD